jgi:hypothetical protein
LNHRHKSKTKLKLLEENIAENLSDFGFGNEILGTTSKQNP